MTRFLHLLFLFLLQALPVQSGPWAIAVGIAGVVKSVAELTLVILDAIAEDRRKREEFARNMVDRILSREPSARVIVVAQRIHHQLEKVEGDDVYETTEWLRYTFSSEPYKVYVFSPYSRYKFWRWGDGGWINWAWGPSSGSYVYSCCGNYVEFHAHPRPPPPSPVSSRRIALRSWRGSYLSAWPTNDNPSVRQAWHIQSWEIFTMRTSNGASTFTSHHGTSLMIWGSSVFMTGGGASLWVYQVGDKYCIRNNDNRHLTAWDNGQITSMPHCQSWEQWHFISM